MRWTGPVDMRIMFRSGPADRSPVLADRRPVPATGGAATRSPVGVDPAAASVAKTAAQQGIDGAGSARPGPAGESGLDRLVDLRCARGGWGR